MLSTKEISYITEKITRRFEIELPLEILDFKFENNKLSIFFQKNDEIAKTFELSKGIKLDLDKESRIIGLNIESVEDFLPKPNPQNLDFDDANEI